MDPAHRVALEALRRLPAVETLVEAAAGGTLHLVGGAVRDALLSRPTYDLDVVVAGGGEAVAQRLSERLGARLVRLGGERFAALRLVGPDLVVDVWDRGAVSLEDDLARRDLTINALALDLASGELLDPFGGLADLERQRLRAATAESFASDPLRVLRLARFAVELPRFQAVPETVRLARAASVRLAEVASERVRYELGRILAGERAARGLALLAHTGVYPGLWLGRAGEGVHASPAPRLLAAFERERGRLETLAPGLFAPLDAPAARWALTLLALPDGSSLQALDHLEEAGYLMPWIGRGARRLIEVEALPESLLERRRFIHHWGELWPSAVAMLAARARLEGQRERFDELLAPLLELARLEGENLIDPPRLLTGNEVRDLLGVAGPAIGQALARVRQAQVDGGVRTREQAVRLLQG